MVRSKTENAISSMNKNNNKNNNSNKIIEQTKNLSINSDKKRYTLEFLLSRSDMAQSQKMPDNWKILNQLYPDVCFNGKIISYFNPNKYFAHWNKVKLQNSELHSFNQTTTTTTSTTTSTTRNNLPHSKSFHSNRFITNQTSSIPSSSSSTSSTDDYLNLKSNNFDSYLKQQTRFIIDTNSSNNNNNNNNKRNFIIHQNVQQQKRFDINHKNSIFNVTTNKNISKSINNNNNNGINQTLFNNTAAHASATNAFKYNDRKNIKFSNY